MNISSPVALSQPAAAGSERSRREDTPAEPGKFAELLARTLAPASDTKTAGLAPGSKAARDEDKEPASEIDPAAVALLFVPVEARATAPAGTRAAGTPSAAASTEALASDPLATSQSPLDAAPRGPVAAHGLADLGADVRPALDATPDDKALPIDLPGTAALRATTPEKRDLQRVNVRKDGHVDEAPAAADPASRVAEAASAAFSAQQEQADSDQRREGDTASPSLQATTGLEGVASQHAATPHSVQASTSPEAPALRGQLEPPVGSREWGSALGQEVVKLHQSALGRAELQLHPAGLGPLHVVITVADQQAQAQFMSAHPAVRAAVEAALPQLRASLADSGISLGQTAVGAEQQSSSSGFMSREPGRRDGGRKYELDEPLDAARPAVRRGNHSVDTFA